MAPRTTIAVLLIGVVVLVAGCDVLASKRPQLLLEVRSQPGDLLGFEPATIDAPTGTGVELSFANVSSIDHNLVFLAPMDARTREIVRPGESDRLEFETPGAGSYRFVCTIHQGMRGSLLVR